MTKVKICGITNLEDALLSAKFGADALGFNFYEKSPRHIAPEKAAGITGKLPENVLTVGVFVNENLEKIAETARIAGLDAIQLHGEETPEFVRQLKDKTNLDIIKAFRVSKDFVPEDVLKYTNADAILLDAFSPKEHGGTGETFDWKIAKKVQEIFPKMYLAGGLSNENIVCALTQIQPFAIDSCSCLEKQKGLKDKVQIINFVTKIQHFSWWQTISSLENYKVSDIYEYLNLIHLRPAMYIGSKSVTRLGNYLFGFRDAMLFTSNDFDFGNLFTNEFHNYIKNKLGKIDYASLNGFDIEVYENNEEEAFDLFYAILEEFKLENEKSTNK